MNIKKRLLVLMLILFFSSASVTAALVALTPPGAALWLVPLITATLFLLSIFCVPFAARKLLKPLNDIDIEHPENNADFDEIAPLLKRVRQRQDRTEAKMRELDRGRAEFAAITENMSEGFLVLDGGGKVLSHNKSAAHMLSSAAGKLNGLNILALNREEGFRETVRLSLTGSPKERIVTLKGRQCQLFANPVLEGGSVQGAILLLLDVTEKQERDKLRHEFTTNVSHELKTPLTVISGYAEIMAGGMVQSADMPGFAGKIYREAKRLIEMMNDLMFLSGLEENTQPEKRPVGLLSFAQEVSGRLAERAAEQNVTITVAGEPVTINGLATVLDEMIFNLIENAVKYNRPGGSVSVGVKKRGGGAELTVSDTGIGIPPADRERIFERFYRADKSRNSAIPGTGLGLSIVKHGAALHGAEIKLKSGDKGSCFSLYFRG